MALAAAAAAVALVALSGDADTEAVVLVDERDGVLHDVRFGDTLQKLRRARGDPTDDAQGFFPEDATSPALRPFRTHAAIVTSLRLPCTTTTARTWFLPP
jgi:hypothetical protein